MVQVYVGGLAPRSDEYMRTHWDRAKGFVGDAVLARARSVEEHRWQDAQRAAGLDAVAPALVAWEDLLRPLCHGPVEAGALTRTFETNTFHRQPRVTALPPRPTLADAARWLDPLHAPADAPWILTLPSPYDAAVRSEDAADAGREAIARAYAAVLNEVAREGLRRGAFRVRFQEPSALYPGHDVDTLLLRESLAAAGAGLENRCILHLTQGDAFDRREVLLANPLRGVAIEDPGRAPPSGLRLPPNTALSAAVVHGDRSLVEPPAALLAEAQALAASLGVPLWGITNGWDLEHVPHAIGVRKLAALAGARAAAGPASAAPRPEVAA